MRTLDGRADVFKFLDSLQPKQYRQVGRKMFALMQNPRPQDSILLRDSFYRTDVGEFRIIYEFDDSSIKIVLIDRRNDDEVYKQFKRLQ